MTAVLSDKKYWADSRAILELEKQSPRLSFAQISVRPRARDFNQVLKEHRAFRARVLSNPNVYEIRKKRDLSSGKSGNMGALFGLQYAPNDLTPENIRELFNESVRFLGIVHEKGPRVYGSTFREEGSLTRRGAELIHQLDGSGIALDLSQANHRTIIDALELISRKKLSIGVMASHSGCYAVHHHPQNLTGEIILRIKELNGYIGIPARTYLIAEKNALYLESFLKHVESAIGICGNNAAHVGIGSDCNHLDMTREEAREYFWKTISPRGTEDCGQYFPDRPPLLIEQGSRMFEILEERLLKRYSRAIAAKICGLNLRNFFSRSLSYC